MIFTSVEYVIFFPIVLVMTLILRGRPQIFFLTASSFIFYSAWNPPFTALLMITCLTDYGVALVIDAKSDPVVRRRWIGFSVLVNLGMLGYFKYALFFLSTAGQVVTAMGGSMPSFTLNVVLPIGISFYTFQSISYILDVYFRRMKPVRSFLDYCCFVSFFPQLVAGPIVRANELIPQIEKRRRIIGERAIREGLRLLYRGFVKKAFVADTLGVMLVDPVFAQPGAYGALTLWLAMVGYAFQVYGDFSGYTDMGRGSAKLLGFDLPVNFNFPYISASIREFYQRFHITLATWLRDYLFWALLRTSKTFTSGILLRNVLITFFLSGLWHGANWTFIVWGLYLGVWLVMHTVWRRWRDRSGREPAWAGTIGYGALARVTTFVLILLSLVIFRSPDLAAALRMFKGLFGFGPGGAQLISGQVLVIMAGVTITHLWSLLPPRLRYLEGVWFWVKDIGLGVVSVYILINLISGARPFIYFQF